jgi:hypothetical protein
MSEHIGGSTALRLERDRVLAHPSTLVGVTLSLSKGQAPFDYRSLRSRVEWWYHHKFPAGVAQLVRARVS